MKSSIEHLSKVLPISEYKKINKIYDFIYNIFIFIYRIDSELFNDTNFICNYLIHKQINKDIMYNKLCYGTTDIKFVNSLDVYYISLAGINILLENVMIDKKSKTELPYNITKIMNNNDIDEEYLLENINNKSIDNYFKILFYIELFNKNNISEDIILELKKLFTKILKKHNKELNNK